MKPIEYKNRRGCGREITLRSHELGVVLRNTIYFDGQLRSATVRCFLGNFAKRHSMSVAQLIRDLVRNLLFIQLRLFHLSDTVMVIITLACLNMILPGYRLHCKLFMRVAIDQNGPLVPTFLTYLVTNPVSQYPTFALSFR